MEPNRNDSPNGKKPEDNKKPKGNIWVALIITVALVLIIGSVYNMVVNSQYTQTTYSDFLDAKNANKLAEVQFQPDRIIYLTKEEAAKPAAQQKASFTGLPSYADTLALMDELHAMGELIFTFFRS